MFAQGVLNEERQRLEIALEAGNIGTWDFDPVTREGVWSRKCYDIFDIPAGTPITVEQYLRSVHPEDRSQVAALTETALNTRKETDYNAIFRLCKNAAGEIRWLKVTGKVFVDEQRQPVRFIGTALDITAQKEAEELAGQKNSELLDLLKEFTFVTDFMPQMVWATQPDGYHDFYNKRWYDFTGLTYEETKDKGWSLVLHPDDSERAWQVWKHSLDTGALYQIEYRMRRYDGEYRWFLARAMPLRDEAGNILKWFGTCTDIHDQKAESQKLEQLVQERTRHLQQVNNELKRSNEYLQQFAYISSHDLKEPLRKITTLSDLLANQHSQGLGEQGLDLLRRLRISTSRMNHLVQDLLTYSQATNAQTTFQPVDLNVLIQGVLTDLDVMIHETKAQVKIGSLPQLPGDPMQLAQLWQNLLVNALKFRRADVTPVIRVTCQRLPAGVYPADLAFPLVNLPATPPIWWEISVQDNGIGFPIQYKERIFQVFQQLHSRGQYDGTGVGLAICRRVAENHNGAIGVDTEPGAGTTFRIYLPA
ncbi:hypothetical protein GCM10023189_30460 [Nibrella saemangeumensis]|uniref:histidine kinase n=1 Tax=Nibrella saemangeumensis TaxID=1084526 RepID=A0ABP8N0F1_9BACT